METDALPDEPDYDPIIVRLVNGHNVKIAVGRFWEIPTPEDRALGAQPHSYNAMRIYCSEGTLPLRMVQQEELREGLEYEPPLLGDIWNWLVEHTSSREWREHDSFDGFLETFTEAIERITATADDAVSHLEHLPEMVEPEAFDRVDDSVFNDQNERDAPSRLSDPHSG
jgi:hypothetical protein